MCEIVEEESDVQQLTCQHCEKPIVKGQSWSRCLECSRTFLTLHLKKHLSEYPVCHDQHTQARRLAPVLGESQTNATPQDELVPERPTDVTETSAANETTPDSRTLLRQPSPLGVCD